MGKKPNSYELSRMWFEFCFDNPEKINPKHAAIYFFAIERCNRLGWKNKFGFPSADAMENIGIKKHQTYKKAFDDLVEWGFFELIQESKNQWTSNVISLATALPKKGKAKHEEPPVCPAKKRQSKQPVPCQKTAEQKTGINQNALPKKDKVKGERPSKCFAEKGHGKGHIVKPVKTKQTSQKEKIIKEMKEFGWLADFKKVFGKIPFKAIKYFWENKLSKEIESISPDQRGGNITNRIKAEAQEFYEKFIREKEITETAKKEAEEYQRIIVAGKIVWSLKRLEEKNRLFDGMKGDTGLCGTLCQNTGESKNEHLMEKIFKQLGQGQHGSTRTLVDE